MKYGLRQTFDSWKCRAQPSNALSIAFATVILCLLIGCYTAPEGPWTKYKPALALTAEVTRVERNLRVFDSAWDAVNELYYDAQFHGIDWRAARERYRPKVSEASDDEQLYRVINAMLGELKDSHTGASSSQVLKARRKHLEVSFGLGLAGIHGSPNKLIIVEVLPGGPGADAGVKTGWILETCNDQPARAFMENGPLQEGQSVDCTFLDVKDQPCQRTLIARTVTRLPVLETRPLANGVIYLRFDTFNYPSLKWLITQIRTHAKAPAIILDLRQNPGGHRYTLQYIANAFLPRATSLGTSIRNETSHSIRTLRMGHLFHFLGREYSILDLRSGPIYQGRLAVLTSSASASSSEILSEAIKHHHRGVIIGTKTAGAVLSAWSVDLPDGGELQVSIQDYRSPAGHRLEGVGVKPDIAVNRTYNFLRAGIDSDIEAALVALQKPLLK